MKPAVKMIPRGVKRIGASGDRSAAFMPLQRQPVGRQKHFLNFQKFLGRSGLKPALLGLCIGAALLSGCKVGPNYHPPKTEMPSQWTSEMVGGETNRNVGDAAWWKTFNDAELNSLIARAAQSNLNLRVAEARVREARASRGVVASSLGPTVNADGSYQRERLSQNGFPEFPPGIPLEGNIYQAGFDATWELDVFGGTRRAIEAANASIGAAESARREVLVSLLGEVARNYVEARSAQRRLAIARDNITAQQQQV